MRNLCSSWLSQSITTNLRLNKNQSLPSLHLPTMAMASAPLSYSKPRFYYRIECRKRDRDRDRDRDYHPFMVVDVTPPTKNLGIRCFPNNIHCGETVTIEDRTYTVAAVTHRYQLRKGKYEPSEKRLDVQSTGRYILNLYLENLLDKS